VHGGVLLCAIVCGAFFEAMSVGVIIPFIAVLKKPELLFQSRYVGPLLSSLNITDPRDLFFLLGPVLIGLFVIKTGYLLQLYRWLFRYALTKQVSLSRQLLAGFLSAPYTMHIQRNSAELIRATTRTVEDFSSGFMVNLLILLGEFFVLLAVTSLLMLVEPLATLGALTVIALPTALIYRSTHRRLSASGRMAEQSFGLMIQWAEQAINSVKEITLARCRSFFVDQHNYHVQRFTDAWQSLNFLTSIPRLVIDALAVSAVVAIAAIQLERGQDLQSILLLLGMFALAAIRLVPSTSRIGGALAHLRYHYTSTDAIYRELVALKKCQSETLSVSAERPISPMPFRRALVIEHLSYSYPVAHQPAIVDVSIEIPRGNWVSFIGPTGSGKTTLADLMLGLLVPTSGQILVDGRNLHDDVASWQRNIGYVSQNVYLMDDSIRHNIALGVPEEDIDDGRIWNALRAAQIDQLVRSLPGELNSGVGERGGRLSGGERQRLGIARALYRDPEVLVIDEATANLDPGTEAAIVEAIGELRGKKTIIVITHRPAFVRNSDCIYMMARGRIRNSGPYAELLSKEPDFVEFCGGASGPVAIDAAS